MHKISYALAIFGVLAWSGAASAVFQETTLTITDNGTPIPSATVTLKSATPTEKHEAPRPKTAKTDEHGKIVLEHDEEDKKSNSLVEVTVTTDSGKTITRRSTLTDLLADTPFDVSVRECPDPENLSDLQLKTMLNNPKMRTRITTLIDERKEAKREHQTTKKTKGRKKQDDTENETAVRSQPNVSIDISGVLGGRRRNEQGNEKIPRSEELGHKGQGGGFGTGGGGGITFGR